MPEATPDHVRIVAYNLDSIPVKAQMTGWEIDPGMWMMTQGTVHGLGDAMPAPDAKLADANTKSVAFERSKSINVTFAPRTITVIELLLKTKGVPYWSRPDLGIDPEDVEVNGQKMTVTVHSVGAVDAPPSKIVVRAIDGKTIATANVPALKAPADLTSKTAQVSVTIPAGTNLKGSTVMLESSGETPEITLMNNSVTL